jgi:predicted nucleic acid-binding protein
MIISLDTNIVIYAVEQHPAFGPQVRTRLAGHQASGDSLMICDLTRMECLVGPLRYGNLALEAQFRTFFSSAGVQVSPVTAAVCDRAAAIRAATRFKPLDALLLAAAIEHGAGVFLTNDARLNAFTGLNVQVL